MSNEFNITGVYNKKICVENSDNTNLNYFCGYFFNK